MTSVEDHGDESAGLRLYVNVRRSQDGPVLVRKDISDAELWDHRGEAWQQLVLRQGRPEVGLEEVRFSLQTIAEAGDTGRLTGFALVARSSSGRPLRYEFDLHAAEDVAASASRELIASGLLQAGEEYYYELRCESARPAAPGNGTIHIRASSARLEYLRHPIGRLWKAAEKRGAQDARWAPVFYTREALARAESFARRGGNAQPPVETGCILVGVLCSCPETGEFYTVVRDALEAQDAESKAFSLEYTGRTWARLQAILRARRSLPGGRADRYVGQAHGHPFLPAGGLPPCEICAGRPEVPCARTSCFVSVDDSAWSRAVFARQPWQLCHIFGLNARQEQVDKLFGLRNGQLVERGFAVVPEFAMESIQLVVGSAT